MSNAERPQFKNMGIVGDFKQGTIISGRYYIESLIGKGGMGAIYKARDQLLNIPVAVKFLLSHSDDHVAQMLNEVRFARSITHPTICRVYDIGSMDSLFYFTMELIEGEDLTSLLRRIGRLSTDKVLDISRQLCAGLAAAHSKGILHRDLKPANIMIDREGKIKITDFGLATSMDWRRQEDGPVGTLLYMAPEQFSGGELDERSDIYALGMVLYELITGKPPYKNREILKLYQEKMENLIIPPQDLVSDVPISLQAVILKSLDPIPDLRPANALEVATRLPGIDALHVAHQAGVTPRPEMVALGEGLVWNTAPVRWTLFALLPLLLAGILLISDRSTGIGHLQHLKAPEILADRCEGILAQLDYAGTVRWTDYGFIPNVHPKGAEDAVLFWYLQHREANRPVLFAQTRQVALNSPDITKDTARLLILLNASQQLIMFNLESSIVLDHSRDIPIDWADMLALSGIQSARTKVAQTYLPRVFADRRHAWESDNPDQSGQTLCIEAAEFENRPVYYSIAPCDDHFELPDSEPVWFRNVTSLLSFPITLFLIGWTIFLGIRNYREGRSDNLGGKRLIISFFVVTLIAGLLSYGHIAHPFETDTDSGLMLLIGWPVLVWLCYMALEPFARKHCSHTLIAWSRFLQGQMGDRAVGFSILAGASFGSLGALIGKLDRLIPDWIGTSAPLPFKDIIILNSCINTRLLASTFLYLIPSATTISITALFILVLLYSRIPSRTYASAIFVLFYSLFWGVDGTHFPISILSTGLVLGMLTLFVVFHFGLLTTIIGTFVGHVLWIYPITLNTQSWFSEIGFMTIGFVLLMGIGGFLIAGNAGLNDDKKDSFVTQTLTR